jgi:hypothetical protein
VLVKLAAHLDVLRRRETTRSQKLIAAKSFREHSATLDQLGRSSRDTYRDLKTAIGRIHHHLNTFTSPKRSRLL